MPNLLMTTLQGHEQLVTAKLTVFLQSKLKIEKPGRLAANKSGHTDYE